MGMGMDMNMGTWTCACVSGKTTRATEQKSSATGERRVPCRPRSECVLCTLCVSSVFIADAAGATTSAMHEPRERDPPAP